MRVICTGSERDAYLALRFAEIRSRHSGAIALYGAGIHTQRLLKRKTLGLGVVLFVLDDHAKPGDEIAGVPVVRPADADAGAVEAVVVSSDRFEEEIYPRALAWFHDGAEEAAVYRLYEDVQVRYNELKGASVFEGAFRLDRVYMEKHERSLVAAGVVENLNRIPRFYNLINLFGLTRGLAGHTAEAGCYRGQSSYLLCNEMRLEKPGFTGLGHTIFDSFEGFAEPIQEDGNYAQKRFDDYAFTDTSVEHVRNTLKDFPEVEIHKGWIPSVFSNVEDREYRFVHIDVDMYEPTLAGLEYFYPKLVPGGVLVVDDYGPWPKGAYVGCAAACHEFAQKHGVGFAPLNTGNAIFLKR